MISRSASRAHLSVRLRTRTAKILAGTVLVGTVCTVAVARDEGLKRAVTMQSTAIVPLIKYRYYDWRTRDWPKEERAAIFEALHKKYSKIMLDTFLEMRGFYIKFGQLVSGLDNEEQVPRIYSETLKVLQNNCPSRPVSEVIQTIEAELGKPVGEVFASIDPKPLGSASIGQVHRARLLSGEEVAVKVQHPEAERFFNVDFHTAKAFTRLAQPAQVPFFDEIEKQFRSEFDYKLEAKNLQDMCDALEKGPQEFRDGVVVPRPLMSTRKVLVMTFVPGKTLYAQQRSFIKMLAEKENKSEKAIEDELKAKVTAGSMPAPPSAFTLKAYTAAVKTRDYIRNGFALGYNYGIGKWIGAPIKYEWSETPMDAERALSLLYGTFGYTMFKHGIFSSDPHGGNVMHVAPGGKLGLIDMGQMKRLDMQERVKFARLVLALADDDDSEESTKLIAERWRDCGYISKHGNEQVTADLARMFFDRMDDDLVNKYGGLALSLEQMEKIDPAIKLPGDFVLCMRASMMLRMNAMGLGYGLEKRPFYRVAPLWAPYASALLAEQDPTSAPAPTTAAAKKAG